MVSHEDTEAKGNSEMAYLKTLLIVSSIFYYYYFNCVRSMESGSQVDDGLIMTLASTKTFTVARSGGADIDPFFRFFCDVKGFY